MSAEELEDYRAAGEDFRRELSHAVMRDLPSPSGWSANAEYKSEFGEVDLNDVDLNENIADLICEKKKLSKSEIPSIVSNIEENFKLIYLDIDNIPKELVNKMNELYNG